MKKTILAIAALLAVTAMADVTSANVVGYANRELIYGYQGVGTSFSAIGKEGEEGFLTDLRVTGYGDAYEEQGITAVKLDIFGRDLGDKAFWVDADYGNDGVWKGWFGGDEWEKDLNHMSLAPGEGVWFRSPNPNFKIINSGQVNNKPIAVALIYGYQLCPNPTPVELKMNAAQIKGYGESYEDQGITAVKLDIFGRDSGEKMFWVDADYGEDGVWYGWYDGDTWEQELGETITLKPGEAVWLKCPTDGWQLIWPSPLNADK